jgi:hypothetical protein
MSFYEETGYEQAGMADVEHEPDLTVYPEPHEWVDEPDPATKRAIDEAMEDLAAGRFLRCDSAESFEALLDEFAAQPKPSHVHVVQRVTRAVRMIVNPLKAG